MNLRLELTKSLHKGNSELSEAIQKGDNKKSLFYEAILTKYNGEYSQDLPMQKSYAAFFDRYYQAIEQTSPTLTLPVQTQSPLLIGNGSKSVLESHLTLHATYGVPYLPGTALKGLAAHYCRRELGRQQLGNKFLSDGDYYQVLYGSTKVASSVIYYDALPVANGLADLLKLDVITPHHQKYYQVGNGEKGKKPAPRDDDSPIPLPLLSVQGSFMLALGWNREPRDPAAQEWMEIAKQILLQALELEGLGGKTNAGYGRIISGAIEREGAER